MTSSYEIVKHDEPKVFPNPTNDKVYITTGDRTILQKDIFISDLAGRNVQAKIDNPNGNVIQVDLSGMESGVYFIRLNFSDEQKLFKIVKQ